MVTRSEKIIDTIFGVDVLVTEYEESNSAGTYITRYVRFDHPYGWV